MSTNSDNAAVLVVAKKRKKASRNQLYLLSEKREQQLREIVAETLREADEQDIVALRTVEQAGKDPVDTLIADRWELMRYEVSEYLKGRLTYDGVVSRWGEANAPTQWTAIVTVAEFACFFSPKNLHPTAVYKLVQPAPKIKKGGA